MTEIGTLHHAVTAADYLLAALGPEGATLALIALRADWLTPDEAAKLEPLAAGIAYLMERDVPAHRGEPATTKVVRR